MRRVILCVFFGLMGAGCTSHTDFTYPVVHYPIVPKSEIGKPYIAGVKTPGQIRAERWARVLEVWRTAPQARAAEYAIGVDDVIEVNYLFFGAADFSDRIITVKRTIPEDGMLNLPWAGDVMVLGITLRALEEKIRAAGARFVKAPQVAVNVVEYRSTGVFVAGGVNKPGVYYLAGRRNTVLDLIEKAGGLQWGGQGGGGGGGGLTGAELPEVLYVFRGAMLAHKGAPPVTEPGKQPRQEGDEKPPGIEKVPAPKTIEKDTKAPGVEKDAARPPDGLADAKPAGDAKPVSQTAGEGRAPAPSLAPPETGPAHGNRETSVRHLVSEHQGEIQNAKPQDAQVTKQLRNPSEPLSSPQASMSFLNPEAPDAMEPEGRGEKAEPVESAAPLASPPSPGPAGPRDFIESKAPRPSVEWEAPGDTIESKDPQILVGEKAPMLLADTGKPDSMREAAGPKGPEAAASENAAPPKEIAQAGKPQPPALPENPNPPKSANPVEGKKTEGTADAASAGRLGGRAASPERRAASEERRAASEETIEHQKAMDAKESSGAPGFRQVKNGGEALPDLSEFDLRPPMPGSGPRTIAGIKPIEVDLRQLMDEGNLVYNLELQNGDVIVVPPVVNKYIYVLGYVRTPGQFVMTDRMQVDVVRAVGMAGGLADTARSQNSYLVRQTDEGVKQVKLDLVKVYRGIRPTIYMQAGDMLVVGTDEWVRLVESVRPSMDGAWDKNFRYLGGSGGVGFIR